MSKSSHLFSSLLSQKEFPSEEGPESEKKLKALQLEMLRIQQGIWHGRKRAIILFEGFDASGKGGAIRKLVAKLDPRGFRVYGIGPPDATEKSRHYLDRFWTRVPNPGMISIFDRSWYGRLLVERVEKLTPAKRRKEAYGEINDFEKLLKQDGVVIVKILLAIHPEEQLTRFEERLRDPAKFWKLREDDLRAHRRWDKYVHATDDLLRLTNSKHSPWHLVPADSKPFAQRRVLEIVTETLGIYGDELDRSREKRRAADLRHDLRALRKVRKH